MFPSLLLLEIIVKVTMVGAGATILWPGGEISLSH